MERSQVAIIIPAYNEEKTIYGIVKNIKEFGIPIVVDDGSLDGTSVNAMAAGALVVRHDKNLGYDDALNSGFIKAKALGSRYIVTMDADGQHNPVNLLKFIDAFNSGFEMVLGVRRTKQRFSESIFSYYTKLRFGIKDPLCGMKGYKAELYHLLGHFDSYRSIGTELMLVAALNRFKFIQLEIKISHRTGKSRFGDSLTANLKILRSLVLSIIFVRTLIS